ncbi:YhcB family protein [Zooshikella sp. RANM57]|uniref:YhcB family protein n=1 Tax=Zooshikella sp. RANM57 TaxID=3425863 RepID=UPI003D6EB360
MELTENLWLASCISFVIGSIIGAWLYRASTGGGERSQLEAKLSAMEKQMQKHQQELDEHFNQTAQLFNRVTDAYKDLQAHMANSAATLSQDPTASHQLTDTLLASQTLSPEPEGREKSDDTLLTPPKDYAPKSAPDEKGTLSEEFGLQQSIQPQPAK